MLEHITRTVGDEEVAIPRTEEQSRLLMRIKRAIRRKTSGGVQKLAVQTRGEAVLLRGRCTSFYCKQVAQATAMSLLEPSGEQVLNEIEVSLPPH